MGLASSVMYLTTDMEGQATFTPCTTFTPSTTCFLGTRPISFLYVSESWTVLVDDMKSLEAFYTVSQNNDTI